MRSGTQINQPTGYKAFIPNPIPPNPPIRIEGEIQHLLTNANIAIGKMDTMGVSISIGKERFNIHFST